jgi:PncC family amidohydrolase
MNDLKKVAFELSEYLLKNKLTFCAAESCTAGLITSTLAEIPGASEFLLGGVCSYANEVKINILGVPEEIIKKFGAVSPECAAAMAEGIAKLFRSDIAVSVTGIAGPGGGSPEKPVGLVYIGVSRNGQTTVEKHLFAGSRQSVREEAAEMAMMICRERLCQIKKHLKESES